MEKNGFSFARAYIVNETKHFVERVNYCLEFTSRFSKKPREHDQSKNGVQFN